VNRPFFALVPGLAVVLGVLAGCGDDPAAPADLPPVMDLAVGNSWRYAARINEPAAPIRYVDRIVTGHRTIEVGGQDLEVAVEMPDPQNPPGVHGGGFLVTTGRLLRNEADGLYSYGAVDTAGAVTIRGRALVAPRQAGPGDRFDQGGGWYLVCVAADSLVATDFGDVTADVYELVGDEGTLRVPEVYVVPGVGRTRYYNPQWTAWIVAYTYPEPAGGTSP